MANSMGFPPPLPPLPQSNGVNITIINPTTNVTDTVPPPVPQQPVPFSATLVPNPADSFTPMIGTGNGNTLPPLTLPPSNG